MIFFFDKAEIKNNSHFTLMRILYNFSPGPRIFPKNNGEKSVKSVKILFLHR